MSTIETEPEQDGPAPDLQSSTSRAAIAAVQEPAKVDPDERLAAAVTFLRGKEAHRDVLKKGVADIARHLSDVEAEAAGWAKAKGSGEPVDEAKGKLLAREIAAAKEELAIESVGLGGAQAEVDAAAVLKFKAEIAVKDSIPRGEPGYRSAISRTRRRNTPKSSMISSGSDRRDRKANQTAGRSGPPPAAGAWPSVPVIPVDRAPRLVAGFGAMSGQVDLVGSERRRHACGSARSRQGSSRSSKGGRLMTDTPKPVSTSSTAKTPAPAPATSASARDMTSEEYLAARESLTGHRGSRGLVDINSKRNLRN